MEEDFRLLEALMRSSERLKRRIALLTEAHRLCLTEFGVLEALSALGPQPIQQVAERILVTSGSMTYIVDKLEKRGLVCREPCERDRRVCYLRLTEEGTGLLAELMPEHDRAVEDFFGAIGAADKKVLAGLLRRLC